MMQGMEYISLEMIPKYREIDNVIADNKEKIEVVLLRVKFLQTIQLVKMVQDVADADTNAH